MSPCGCQAGSPGPQSLRGWWGQLGLGHCREVGGGSGQLRGRPGEGEEGLLVERGPQGRGVLSKDSGQRRVFVAWGGTRGSVGHDLVDMGSAECWYHFCLVGPRSGGEHWGLCWGLRLS